MSLWDWYGFLYFLWDILIVCVTKAKQRGGDYMKEKEYTDILVLYNAAGFAEDASVAKLAMASES